MATITTIWPEDFAYARIASADHADVWDGSAMDAKGDVSPFGSAGVLTPVITSVGVTGERQHVVTLPGGLPDDTDTNYWLYFYRATPVDDKQAEMVKFRVGSGTVIEESGWGEGTAGGGGLSEEEVEDIVDERLENLDGATIVIHSNVLSDGIIEIQQDIDNSYTITIADFEELGYGTASGATFTFGLKRGVDYRAGRDNVALTGSVTGTMDGADLDLTFTIAKADAAALVKSPTRAFEDYKYEIRMTKSGTVNRLALGDGRLVATVI